MYSIRSRWMVLAAAGVLWSGQAFGLIEVQEGSVLETDFYIWGFTPDGSYVAGGSESRRDVRVYDASTGERVGIALLPPDVEAQDVEMAADGRVFVGGQGSGVYCFTRSGAPLWSRRDIAGENCVGVARAGELVFTVEPTGDPRTKVFHRLDGETGADLIAPKMIDSRGWSVWGVDAAADGSRVLLETNSDVIITDEFGVETYFYDIVAGNSMYSAKLSPDGTYFVAIYWDPVVLATHAALYEVGVGLKWTKNLGQEFGKVGIDAHHWVYVSREGQTVIYNTTGSEIVRWGDGSSSLAVAADGNRCVVLHSIYDVVDVYDCYPDLHLQAYLTDVVPHGPGVKRYTLTIANCYAVPPALFAPSPELEPCGLNDRASRTYLRIRGSEGTVYLSTCGAITGVLCESLKQLWFFLPDSTPLDPYVYVELWDRKCDVIMNSPYAYTGRPCPVGDLDGDCIVNLLDLAWMAENWLVDGNP